MAETTAQTATGDTPRDRWVDAGIWTVGVTAAVASWAGWVGLAKMCGWTDSWHALGVAVQLAWLLPFAVDVYALIGFRVWLRVGWTSPGTRSYARWSTFAAIGLGVAGNAGYHLMVSLGWTSAPWLVVVAVSSLPPIMLGAVAHLSALATRDLSQRPRTTPDAPRTEVALRKNAETAEPATVPEPTQARPAAPAPRHETTRRAKSKTTPRLHVVDSLSEEERLDTIRRAFPNWRTEEVSLKQIGDVLSVSGQATKTRLKRALYGGQTPSEAARLAATGTADPDRELAGVS